MTRRGVDKMTRRHIWIDDDVWERIGQFYGDSLGQSAAIRAILKAFVRKIESKAEGHGKNISPIDMEELEK